MIKAVLFDMDGTVLDTEPLYIEAWKKAFEKETREFEPKLFNQCVGLSVVMCEQLVDEFYGEKGMYRRAVKVAAEWMKYYIETEGAPVKTGFYKLSDFLRENGIKAIIATSSLHADAARHLTCAGILDRFDGIVGGDATERGKPYPDPYVKAAELAGVSRADCIAVEDSKNGVLSAVEAGIRCVYIKDLLDIPKDVEAKAYRRAESLDEVIDIIKEEAL